MNLDKKIENYPKMNFSEYAHQYINGVNNKNEDEIYAFWRGRFDAGREVCVIDERDPSEIVSEDYQLRYIANRNLLKGGFTDIVIFLSSVVFSTFQFNSDKRVFIDYSGSNRFLEGARDTVGCLLDKFPLVVDVHRNITYAELLREVRRAYLNCLDFRPASFLKMISELGRSCERMVHINWMTAPDDSENIYNSTVNENVHKYISPMQKDDSAGGDVINLNTSLRISAVMNKSEVNINLQSMIYSQIDLGNISLRMGNFFESIKGNLDEKCFP